MKEIFEGVAYTPEKIYSDMIHVYNRKNSCIFYNGSKTDICFFGDSITEGWELSVYFQKYGIVRNRGIGGETVAQGRKRFYWHVVQLSPKVCVFMEGINDIYIFNIENPSAPEDKICDFLKRMKEDYENIILQAKEAKIQLVLCSVLPLGVADARNDLVVKVNQIIKSLCQNNGIVYVDYYSSLSDSNGVLLDVTNGDLIHPLGKGYNIMADVLNENILKNFQCKV